MEKFRERRQICGFVHQIADAVPRFGDDTQTLDRRAAAGIEVAAPLAGEMCIRDS